MKKAHRRVRLVTPALLRKMPLPRSSDDDDKEDRGRVLVIGGAARTPGAPFLAGVAALRAGAGKLQLGTIAGAAMGLGLALPEALVLALPQTRHGAIATARTGSALRSCIAGANAILVGPGMEAGISTERMVHRVARAMSPGTTLILDAGAIALSCIGQLPATARASTIITPNMREMAMLLGAPAEKVAKDAPALASAFAVRWRITVTLKGAHTWIADRNGLVYCYRDGAAGLGTSGSGDVLAGIIAGLGARGASPVVASVRGVNAHGAAGRALSARIGKLGYLARELLDEIPSFTNSPSGTGRSI